MQLRVQITIVLLVSVLTGCFREILVTPGSFENYADDAIVVMTRDGRRIGFSKGEYKLVGPIGQQAIKGKGKLYYKNASEFKAFEGEVSLDEIERITTSETTPWLYISIAVVSLTVALFAWLSFGWGGGGLGG
jgi:hypothetical protein